MYNALIATTKLGCLVRSDFQIHDTF